MTGFSMMHELDLLADVDIICARRDTSPRLRSNQPPQLPGASWLTRGE